MSLAWKLSRSWRPSFWFFIARPLNTPLMFSRGPGAAVFGGQNEPFSADSQSSITLASLMIEFQQLPRSYGDFTAVKPLSLTVERGEMFGFLGPNGAGKTTTIRMMMGILVPSGGRALIHGLDCHAKRAQVQRHVGYLPDNPIYYDFL